MWVWKYEQDDYIASMYTEKNLSTLTAAYFQRLTPAHVLAATFSYNLKTTSRPQARSGNRVPHRRRHHTQGED